MSELKHRHCTTIKKEGTPLAAEAANALLAQLQGWAINEDGVAISREFRFKNYYQTMAFVNAVAWMAHQEDHHPDLEVGYNRCLVRYSTHAVGGLTDNDFICAAKVDALSSMA